MKKLMIAAVAAAMAGVVLADYNFSATLKTTQGRKGTETLTTLNLGKNGNVFWYQDPLYTGMAGLTGLAGGYWKTTKPIDGVNVDTIKKTTTKDGTVENKNGAYLLNGSTAANYATAVGILKTLAANYTERSAGRYCETVMVVDPAKCYRIAGTKRIDQTFSLAGGQYNDCCTTLGGTLTLAGTDVTTAAAQADGAVPVMFDNGVTTIGYMNNQVAATQALIHTLYQRFGGQTSRAANRVEIYAAVPRARTTDGATFAGWIAGQGTVRSTNTAGVNPMDANTISGNIVGILTAPDCENCCSISTPSVAFDCVSVAVALPYSAAYGTFHLRWVR